MSLLDDDVDRRQSAVDIRDRRDPFEIDNCPVDLTRGMTNEQSLGAQLLVKRAKVRAKLRAVLAVHTLWPLQENEMFKGPWRYHGWAGVTRERVGRCPEFPTRDGLSALRLGVGRGLRLTRAEQPGVHEPPADPS